MEEHNSFAKRKGFYWAEVKWDRDKLLLICVSGVENNGDLCVCVCVLMCLFGVTKLKTIEEKKFQRRIKKMLEKIHVGYSNRRGFELNYLNVELVFGFVFLYFFYRKQNGSI